MKTQLFHILFLAVTLTTLVTNDTVGQSKTSSPVKGGSTTGWYKIPGSKEFIWLDAQFLHSVKRRGFLYSYWYPYEGNGSQSFEYRRVLGTYTKTKIIYGKAHNLVKLSSKTEVGTINVDTAESDQSASLAGSFIDNNGWKVTVAKTGTNKYRWATNNGRSGLVSWNDMSIEIKFFVDRGPPYPSFESKSVKYSENRIQQIHWGNGYAWKREKTQGRIIGCRVN